MHIITHIYTDARPNIWYNMVYDVFPHDVEKNVINIPHPCMQ